MIGKTFLYTGLALLAATALRTIIFLVRHDPKDPWIIVLGVACIFISIGLGLTGLQPWKNVKAWTDRLGHKTEHFPNSA